MKVIGIKNSKSTINFKTAKVIDKIFKKQLFKTINELNKVSDQKKNRPNPDAEEGRFYE